MYKTTLNNSPLITVQSKTGKTFNFATDGSLPNPLETTFAAINACAGVFAKKACKELEISPDQISIETIPKNKKEISFNIFGINQIITKISYPKTFTKEQKSFITKQIETCIVKELIKNGHLFEFNTESN